MLQLFRFGLISICIFGAAALPALAWDDVGHKITGYIAWQRMSPRARANVITILRSAPEDSDLATFYMQYGPQSEAERQLDYFILVPTWADIVRDRTFPARLGKYHHSNWHYDDTFWRQVDGKAQALSGFEEGGQAVRQMSNAEKVLLDPTANAADKAIAIAWLAHLTGDIHQPLHTSARVTDSEPKGDQGGNLVLLSPQGTARENQLNLHSFWDSIVVRNAPFPGGICDSDYIAATATRMMKKHRFESVQGKLELGKYANWQKESFANVPTVVFSSDLQRFQMPSAKYRKAAYALAQQQLALAGYRLGETLNNIFGK